MQAALGPADERLAVSWHARGVPLETVRHAILIGCVRTSMALIDRPATQPVRPLRYFEPLLREVQRESFPTSYWRHLEVNLGRCEDSWAASSRGRAGPCRAKNGTGRPGCRSGPCRSSRERTSEVRRDDDAYTFN